MQRSAVLGAIIAIGTISITVSAHRAQQQGRNSRCSERHQDREGDRTNVCRRRIRLADRDTFSGGNTAVFVTDKGVVVVDTKLPGWVRPSSIRSGR